MKRFSNFTQAIMSARKDLLLVGYDVAGAKWQGVDVSAKPEMKTREVMNWCFTVPLGHSNLSHWRQDINPNLPWADRHFEEERVSGQPINPGETWKIWPYGHSAANHLNEQGQFNHTYAERYWPEFAGYTSDGTINEDSDWGPRYSKNKESNSNWGIRYRYGDLNDLVRQLAKDPLTRQAYLPVWFPEDGSHDDRKPCTLGYHFIMRHEWMHVNYYIRSCDIIRHFQDDIYLTVRLLLWILDRLIERDDKWKQVHPGQFSMFITSLHCFANDIPQLKNG